MQQLVANSKTVLYLLLLMAIIIFFGAANFKLSLNIDDYMYTSWLFNYDYGFMRRALPGEIISLLNIDQDYRSIRKVGFVITMILYFSFSFLLLKTIDKLKIIRDKYIYLACYLALPFLCSQWLIELGRFDQIIQVMIMFNIFLIFKNKEVYISFVALFITIILTALIHEASLIIFMPTLLLIFHLNYKNKVATVLSILFVIIAIILLMVFGEIDAKHVSLIIDKYKNYDKFNLYAVRTTALSSWENALTSYYSMINNKAYVGIVFSIIFLYPVMRLFDRIMLNFKSYLIILPTLTPLILFAIAFDYFRWISLIFFNISVLACYLVIVGKVDLLSIRLFIESNKKNIILYSLVSLLFGALGIFNLFPEFKNIGALSEKDLSVKTLTKLNMAADTHDQLFQVNRNIKSWDLELDTSQYENIDLAFHKYEQEAKDGNAFAQNNLAIMYTRGGVLNIDYQKAINLLLLSSQQGNKEANNNLGVIYANGLGVEKNNPKALNYYLLAAKQGSATSMYNLGVSNLKGFNGLKPNEGEAIKWFKKSAEFNFQPAVRFLKS